MSFKLIVTDIGILSKNIFEVKHFNSRVKSVIVTWACVLVPRQPLEQNGLVAEGTVSWKLNFFTVKDWTIWAMVENAIQPLLAY